MQKKVHSLSTRLVVIILLVLIVSTISIGTISYFISRNQAIEMSSQRALGIARSVALAVDSAEYEKTLALGEKTPYWYELEAYLDQVITQNHLVYLYVLYGYDDQDVYYFAEGMTIGDTEMELDFHDTETIDNYDENIAAVFAGNDLFSTEIYSADEWGKMVSGMAPIVNAGGEIIGVVGADIAVDEVLSTADWFGFMILLLVIVISVAMGIAMALYLRRTLGKPIEELTQVSQKIACGELDVDIQTRANTEIGVLADSFRDMVSTTRGQAETLQAISEGNLAIDIVPKSENDVMSHAFINTIRQLNGMLTQIRQLTAQVAGESGQITTSAQSLAKGASSQSAAVEELSSITTEISIQTRQNAELAENAAHLANTMRDDATNSFAQMEQLITAVKDINEASNAVQDVLKVIDYIAFQTNILSLNASVEAARAGEAGKGFAVVAREVQSLSQKTSDSAKETAELIADTLQKTKQGVTLARQVHDAMVKVVSNVKESDRIANEISVSSKEQMLAIEQINQGINQVAHVVSQNSAAAEESANVSQGMNRQAASLSTLVSKFRTREE